MAAGDGAGDTGAGGGSMSTSDCGSPDVAPKFPRMRNLFHDPIGSPNVGIGIAGDAAGATSGRSGWSREKRRLRDRVRPEQKRSDSDNE